MHVPHLQDTTENEHSEGNNTENEKIKLATPCDDPVVATEAREGVEETHVALACNVLMAAKQQLERQKERNLIVLIIGTSQSEKIAVELASKIPAYSKAQVNIFIADSSIERLMAAQDVCSDVIYWPADEDEQSLVDKTKGTCKGGADLILDFIGTPRTIQRSIKILNKGGSLLIGTDALTKTTINLCALIPQQESTIGVSENKNINETIKPAHFQLHRLMSYDPFEV